MNSDEFDKAMTRYEEAVEEQQATQLEEESEQGETRYDDEEDFFQNTVFFEEEEDDVIGQPFDTSEQSFPEEEPSRYRLGDYYVPQWVLKTKGRGRLGHGGQAEVFRCERRGTREIFAAKIHENGLSQKKIEVIETIRDMEDECESIYKIYASGYIDGDDGQNKTYMIVTKLYDKLAKNYLTFDIHGAEADYGEKLRCAVEDLNNALTTIHKIKIRGGNRNIYHSDIKPGNIMWDPKGRGGKGCLVLIDFDGGVVNDMGDQVRSLTNNVETKLYTAPELQAKRNKVNVYTDNFSLGVTLAELVAGVMPTELNLVESNSDEERRYYEKHKKNGIKMYELYLLPAGLPGYVQTMFKGLMYHDKTLTEKRLGQEERWDDDKLKKWIDLVSEGCYEEAESLPCGNLSAKAQAPVAVIPKTENVKSHVIIYSNESVYISSAQEMAEQFVRHWAETVSKLMTDSQFARSFNYLGGDVSYNLSQTRKDIINNPKEKDTVFDKFIESYLSDDFKRENLRYYGRLYASREEFGKKLYAGMVASRDKGRNAYTRLPEVQMDTPREFNDILSMFSKGIVSKFLQEGNSQWRVDEGTMKMIRAVESHMGVERLSAKTVENLYRIAFRLRGEAAHMIGNRVYSNYAEFARQLLRLSKSDIKGAIAIQKKCMSNDGRLKVDMYAWMQETEGVVVRPTEKECEKF